MDTRRTVRAITCAAVAALAAAFLGAASPATGAAAPAPVSHVWAGGNGDDGLRLAWVLPAGADAAVACARFDGVTPQTPTPTGPAEGVCAAPAPLSATLFWPQGTTRPAFAIFSLHTATGAFGPGVTFTGETPPPFAPDGVALRTVSATTSRVGWSPAGGGQTTWLLRVAPGTQPPADTVPPTTVPVAAGVTTVTSTLRGLVPDAVYTVSVQSRDAAGNVSDPAAATTRARTPGFVVGPARGPGSATGAGVPVAPGSSGNPRSMAMTGTAGCRRPSSRSPPRCSTSAPVW